MLCFWWFAQNFFTYFYGAVFNLCGLMSLYIVSEGSVNILGGHNHSTMLLVVNNSAQGILASFFFKFAGENPKP